MAYLNTTPKGTIQGEIAVVERRQLSPDGQSKVTVGVDHMTLHALITHARLYAELIDAMIDADEGDVLELRKHY